MKLRPEEPSDLPLVLGGESPFDDFGPQQRREGVTPAGLDDAGALVIVDDDDQVVGHISWHWNHWGPNAASRCPMIGIWLKPPARGEGIGRRAQREVAELFFRHTGVNRVEAHTDAENLAEQSALEAAGFTREGTIRGAQWRDGAYRDGYLYSILRSDPHGGPD